MNKAFRQAWVPARGAARNNRPFTAEWDRYFKVAMVGGRRMRYLDVGKGSPLLLVHGLGASWKVWCQNLAALTAEHRVVVVDLPGFGASENMVGPIGVEDYGDALAGLLDILDIESTAAVGHSLGGLVCQQLALRYPSRVTALVLVSTTGGVLSTRAKTLFTAIAWGTVPLGFIPRPLMAVTVRNVMAIPALRRMFVAGMVHDPGQVSLDHVAEMVSTAMSSRGTAAAIRAGMRMLSDNDRCAIECAALIISGDKDRITTVAAAEDLARRLPNSTRVTWRGVGHHPMWERPTDFDELLRDFLRPRRTPARGVAGGMHENAQDIGLSPGQHHRLFSK